MRLKFTDRSASILTSNNVAMRLANRWFVEGEESGELCDLRGLTSSGQTGLGELRG